MNWLLVFLLTIPITLTPKKKTEPWAKCDGNVCVVENPLKKSIKMYFECGENYEPFSVVIPKKSQDQVVVDDEKAWCTFDHWEYK